MNIPPSLLCTPLRNGRASRESAAAAAAVQRDLPRAAET